MRFHSTVTLGGKTATGIEVPEEVVIGLGRGKRPPVRVMLGDYSYRTTVAPMGGSYWIPLSAEHRGGAGLAAGDEVEVEIEVDDEPRVVDLPADLATALDQNPAARRAFDALSYSHQRQHVLAVEEAKRPETRQRRIEKAVADLSGRT
jgi:Bacteriocin-protection, YdeI or OmpD-Associated/Domain of unknown function (DUF1905)